MSQVNYDAMSNAQLKQYFLKHREDKAALEAYLDRINQRSRPAIATPGDPNFDAKIQTAIRQQMQARKSDEPAI